MLDRIKKTNAQSSQANHSAPASGGGQGLLENIGATASFAFVHDYHQAMMLRAIQGLGLALTIPPTLSLLTRNSRKTTRGGTMGTRTPKRFSQDCQSLTTYSPMRVAAWQSGRRRRPFSLKAGLCH